MVLVYFYIGKNYEKSRDQRCSHDGGCTHLFPGWKIACHLLFIVDFDTDKCYLFQDGMEESPDLLSGEDGKVNTLLECSSVNTACLTLSCRLVKC